MKILWCCVGLYFVINVLAENAKPALYTEKKITHESNVTQIPSEIFKKLMWKKCSNSSYVICAKLALVHVIEKLDSSESYILLPGISLLKQTDESSSSFLEEVVVRHDFNEALDKYLITKIRRYLASLTLSVKLLDKNTVDDMRSMAEMVTDSAEEETAGRGKKKYMNSLLMAGWMSGATLLALTMKTIAILSGKALLAALLSLMLSVISAFGKSHAETKSTTYEIITKPVISHSHSTDVHEGHGSELNPTYTYKRSINPDIVMKNGNIPSDIEYIIRKIREHAPYYEPIAVEYSKS